MGSKSKVKRWIVRSVVALVVAPLCLVALLWLFMEGANMGAQWIPLADRYYHELEIEGSELRVTGLKRSRERPNGEVHFVVKRMWNYKTWEVRVTSVVKVDESGRLVFRWREYTRPQPVDFRIDDRHACNISLSSNSVTVYAHSLEGSSRPGTFPSSAFAARLVFCDDGELVTATLDYDEELQGDAAHSNEEIMRYVGMLTQVQLHEFDALSQLDWFRAMVERYKDSRE